jgi:lipopolysaccharide transport system permease protein
MGVFPDWRIVLVPFILLVLMFFGFVIGLALTPIGMLYGDIGRAIPIGLQLLMFLSPVVYGLPAEGALRTIMNLNPVTPIIISVRNYMSATDFYMPGYFWIVLATTLFVSLFVWIFYRLSIPIIVER